MFQFSDKSNSKLNTCHPDLQEVMHRSIEKTRVDFGISFGHRTIEEQQKLYAKGRTEPGDIVTNVDGINQKSKHNFDPSWAVDIYGYAGGKVRWDDIHLSYLGGLILSIADKLLEKGIISHKVIWGADWNDNGLLVYDHRLKDLPHFQI